jgi:hypothetical protein
MKWVTRASAILALAFAILQLVRTVSDARDRRRQIVELAKTEAVAKRAGDYERAWASYDQAIKIAESGGMLAKLTGQLSQETRDLRNAQEDLAMAWLDNIRIGPGQTFSSVVDRVAPVLTRGVAVAGGPRKGDLLAHLGYASYLQSRDGAPAGDPAQQYRDALAVDPANPYAHAYLGHWLLGQGQPIADGQAEFTAALASGRAKDYVRELQLAAFRNRGSEGDAPYVAVVNDMRKNGEDVDTRTRSTLYAIYAPACGYRESAPDMQPIVAAAPPAEQAETVKTLLVDEQGIDAAQRATREACVAMLLEAASDRDAAVAAWQAVRKDVPRGDPNGLLPRVSAGLKRLGGK